MLAAEVRGHWHWSRADGWAESSTGGDGETYSVLGMAGAEQQQERPKGVPTIGRKMKPGAQGEVVSAFKLLPLPQLNIKENDLYL